MVDLRLIAQNYKKISNNILFVGLGKPFQNMEQKNIEKFKKYAR